MTTSAGRVRCVRQWIALKLGYRNWLNIIQARKSISGGKANFHAPSRRCPSSNQRSNSVSEAITPAAAGMGSPLNGLPFSAGLACAPLSAAEAVAMQLNRASRNAPHAR